jgi:hypothetical protein
MLKKVLIVAWLAMATIAGACSGSDDGASNEKCANGSEDCACYGNGTCDGTLQCDGQRCNSRSALGGSSGSAGTGVMMGGNAEAGTTRGGNAGTEAMTGGSAGTGGETGGNRATGGTTAMGGRAGSGGMNGGSVGACSDTSADPMNCGRCGHICSADCKSSQCTPYMAGCFSGDDGFATCAAYCTSVGETCVENGCNNGTIDGWANDRGAACERDPGSSDFSGQGLCDSMIAFRAAFWHIRCCCTDTK